MTIEVHVAISVAYVENFFKQLFNLLNLNLWEPLCEQWLKVVKIYENLSGDFKGQFPFAALLSSQACLVLGSCNSR